MSELSDYLAQYYWTAAQLAGACSIAVDELNSLVRAGLAPAPSYVVFDDGRFISAAFGEFQVAGMNSGQHFHPRNKHWVELAIEAKHRVGDQRAQADLKQQFSGKFANALAELNQSTHRMPDSFSSDGCQIEKGIKLRTDGAWDALIAGVFSLCVADPSSESLIARKEVLQEVLTQLSENSSQLEFSEIEKAHIRNLISQYEIAAMPFSPIEYPRSSRKRLVEDFRATLM